MLFAEKSRTNNPTTVPVRANIELHIKRLKRKVLALDGDLRQIATLGGVSQFNRDSGAMRGGRTVWDARVRVRASNAAAAPDSRQMWQTSKLDTGALH